MLNKNLKTVVIATALLMPITAFANQSTAPSSLIVKNQTSWKTASKTHVSATSLKVKVNGSQKDSRHEVMEKALYKAAKVTLDANDRWFRVVNSEVETETSYADDRNGFEARYDRTPVRRCGLLGCTTEYRSRPTTSFSARASKDKVTTYSVILSFETGTGPKPKDKDAYIASDVKYQLG